MMHSLKTQIILVLIILISSLVIQVALSRASQSDLVENQQRVNALFSSVALVRELERDVIDLQRHLLIYKETASESAVTNFYELMGNVEDKLKILGDFKGRKKDLLIDEKQLERMSNHLKDYKENFSGVIDGRSQRNTIFKDNIQEKLAKFSSLINDLEAEVANKGSDYSLSIKYHQAIAEKNINQYLISPDYEYVNEFNEQHLLLREIIKKQFENNQAAQLLINGLKKDFVRLTQITRGYVFLVNVVMAGSANEFLYITTQLRTKVSKAQAAMKEKADSLAVDTRLKNDLVALLCIAITLLMAGFLSKRIITPIRKITDVFRLLALNKEIELVPGINRQDEIGDLAKAADVFHNKNRQTSELLDQAQAMNSQQEMLNLELEKEKENAEQAAKSKSIFLANMSHEIRTPMNGIVGLVDLTLRSELTEQQNTYLRKAAYSGRIMMNVINDILDFSKIEAGKMDIEKIEFSVNDVIENVISSMSVMAEEKEINLRVNTSQQVPKILIGDPLRISQVLLNICSNAVKFTEQGEVSVCFDYVPDGGAGSFKIEVNDSGIGMSQAHINRIFESFTQADGSTSRKFGGTGLGLTIVKELLRMMGGSVNVTSKEGIGSCFKMKIPMKSVGDEKLLEPIEILSGSDQVYYLEKDTPAFLSADIFQSLNINPVSMFENELLTSLAGENEIKLLLIDIISWEYLMKIEDVINRCIATNIKVALISNLYPVNLKHQVQEKWLLPILSHPFSPQTLTQYFHSILQLEPGNVLGAEIEQNSEDIKFSGHVLLVEDNAINQLVAGDVINELGVEYDLAEDGKQAVDKVNSGKVYDLIIMDVQMPVMDGYEATEAIRLAGFNELIICGLSANAMKQDLDMAKEVGMNEYLTKPLQWRELKDIFSKYLAKQD